MSHIVSNWRPSNVGGPPDMNRARIEDSLVVPLLAFGQYSQHLSPDPIWTKF